MTAPPWSADGPGGAPVVVLANSLGTARTLWDDQIDALARHLRVLRYELPGHGGAPAGSPRSLDDLAADLVAVLDAAGAARASVVGVSLGGMVAARVAATHPERVQRLVLANTAAGIPPAAPWHERAARVRAEGTGVLLEALLRRWFHDTPEDGDPLRSRVAAMLAATDPASYAACCEVLAAADLTADLAAIEAPTLVLAGASDPVTPPAAALALQGGITGAALVVLPAASHLAALERPAPFAAAVLAHLVGDPLERGRRRRREVLGDEHVARSEAAASRPARDWAEHLTAAAWGGAWSRPALDDATRSALTVALLCAGGHLEELELHLRACRRTGLPVDAITEVLIHASVYAGIPAANAAFKVLDRVLGDGSATTPTTSAGSDTT